MLSESRPAEDPRPLTLITGATGYVGGRLLRVLQDGGHRIRCLARSPERLRARVARGTEVVRADALSGEGLEAALQDVDAAYYLIHSLSSRHGFETRDRRAAENFARAARAAGVGRIIYLGGLANDEEPLSAHLRSRLEVGEILRESGVPVIELRASVVIGSGSLSFELVRALVEHLPVMLTPRWVSLPTQPIAIDDLLQYLVQSLEVDPSDSPVYEIGGADRTSYAGLMREYARQRGLRRWMIPVPFLSPRLSSLWLGMITPVYARVGRKLIDSIRHRTTVRDPAARAAFRVAPRSTRRAIAAALERESRAFAETRWSDALSSSSPGVLASQATAHCFVDRREIISPVRPASAFAAIENLGGETGYYAYRALWTLRGWIDLLAGGAGMRRGRSRPDRLEVGDTVDCWRVVQLERGHSLRLGAEMRLPGRAWLEYEVAAHPRGARLRQTALFEPAGLGGRLYWYAVAPLHALVFGGMLRGIGRAARELESSRGGTRAQPTSEAPPDRAGVRRDGALEPGDSAGVKHREVCHEHSGL